MSEVLNPFEGCLPHPHAHPIRPWWRFEYLETRTKQQYLTKLLTWMRYRWVRSDGLSFEDQSICDWTLEATPPFRQLKSDLREMDRLDREKPMARPPEFPCQLWVISNVTSKLVSGAPPRVDSGGWCFYEYTDSEYSMQYALVFGPFAPWAPPAWIYLHREKLEESIWP